MFRKRTKTERFWEILPGLQVWVLFVSSILLSYYFPVKAAVFIIVFDFYWLLKAINVAIHMIYGYRRYSRYIKMNWLEETRALIDLAGAKKRQERIALSVSDKLSKLLASTQAKRFQDKIESGATSLDFMSVYHLVLIPFYDESLEVLDSTIDSLSKVNYPKERMLLLLAAEERAGKSALLIAESLKTKYSQSFAHIFIAVHPDDLPGEIKGKSANAAFAVSDTLPKLKALGLSIDQILVSNFDSDTIPHKEYFARVSYEFLLQDQPHRVSYQPIAVYNNNIWDSPSIVRVISASDSFWQFTESSRQDRLRTFTSHTMSLKTLIEVGLWRKDIVNEDGYIFWQCYLHFDGNYSVVPLLVPVSLDTVLDTTFWKTMRNCYKQKRRWAYNVEYWPTLIPGLFKSKVPLGDKLYKFLQYWEQNISWALASILITLVGWLPLIIGKGDFASSVVAFNLPRLTQILMTTATAFLIISVYLNLIMLPKRPAHYTWKRTAMMYLQWMLVPIIAIVFVSLPSLEAQTRLMLGKYLEFWVTPKSRKGEITAHT